MGSQASQRQRRGGFQEAGVSASATRRQRELERYKSIANVSDEEMEKGGEDGG